MARTKKEQDLIARAVKELGIDIPVMATRMVGKRLELHLLGGSVVSWEPGEGGAAPAEAGTDQPEPGAAPRPASKVEGKRRRGRPPKGRKIIPSQTEG